ncbi:MAG TPA: folate family ECF transporter S component [Candidatus Enterenecus stercoripullorum]|nr:folate family ECF transporter S component [Candidatus Enterenecus stercoripullorum]
MNLKVKQLVTIAMLAAICTVLSYFSVKFINFEFTFASIPVHISGLLFGPVDGMLVGGVGTLLYQLLSYGVTATTLLWVLPYALCGGLVGWAARRKDFRLSRVQTVALAVCAELMITLLNTGSLYLDSHIYGYYTPSLIAGVFLLRLAVCVGKATVYGMLLPEVVRPLRRAVRLDLAPQKERRK